jgi:hypothetical protein
MAVSDLPRADAPKSKVKVRALYGYKDDEGKPFDYRLIRPNAMIGNAVMAGPDGGIDAKYINQYLTGHVHPDDREKFKAALMGDDGLDLEVLMEMMGQMNGLVYDDLPSQPS